MGEGINCSRVVSSRVMKKRFNKEFVMTKEID